MAPARRDAAKSFCAPAPGRAAVLSALALLLCAPASTPGLAQQAPKVLAQNPPGAGTLLREYGPTVQPAVPQTLPPPSAAAPQPYPPPIAGAKVLVKDFHIVASKFPEAVLKDVVKQYIGRELTLAELQEAAGKISEFYRVHDLLARAYIPRQTVKEGVVEIDVLEGKLGAITVDPSSVTRLDTAIATGIVAARSPVGESVHPQAIQEGVAIVNEIPGVTANATLEAGKAEGETNAVLKLADRPLFSGQAQADNEGTRYAGEHRLIATASLNDYFGLGEQGTLTELWTSGSTYSRVGATVPVGTSGLTLGANLSGLLYHLGEPFNVLDEGGYAYTAGLTAAYPIRRVPDLALTAIASFDHKRLVDWALGTDTADRRLEVGSVGILGLAKDDWLGGGTDNFSVVATVGDLDRGADAFDLATDAATARTQGAYGKLSASVSRLQTILSDTQIYGAASAQFGFKNLESSEKFSLGGPNGVRAYPVNEGLGDRGGLATIELRHNVLEQLQLYGFYDVGGVEQHVSTWSGWQTVPGQPNLYLLEGIGAGAGWSPITGLLVKATVARAIGDNPGHDINGDNSDGKKGKNRYWVQIGYLF